MAVALPLPAAVRFFPRRLTLSLVTEVALVAGLVAFAAAMRYPYLWHIPEFTDETWELWRAYDIYRGRLLPLTNITTFVGPLWNYLVAAMFWATGPSPFTPRLLIMTIGTLTIVPTYLLGREIGGPRAGLIAAALLTTSGGHIVSNSHIAWSSCTTPLFAVTAFWLLARAPHRRNDWSLAGAGLFSGLAWLTHGTFMFLLPGMAAFVLWQGRAILRTRWILLAGALFLLAYSPLIVYNLRSGFDTVADAIRQDAGYRTHRTPGPQGYILRSGVVLGSTLRLVGGAIDERAGGMRDYLFDPKVWLYGLLGVSGLGFAWRAGQPLPALIIGSGLLVWPFFHAPIHSLPVQSRYLLTLLIPAYAAVGLLLAHLLDRSGRARKPVLWLGTALLVAYPVLPLWSFYRQQQQSGRTNEVGYSMLAAVEQHRRLDERVLLDPGINYYSFGGNGMGQRAFRYLRGISTVDMQTSHELTEYLDCNDSRLMILRTPEFRKLGEQAPALERKGVHLAILAPPGPTNPIFGLYRLQRDPCPAGKGAREEAARRERRAAEREAESKRDSRPAP